MMKKTGAVLFWLGACFVLSGTGGVPAYAQKVPAVAEPAADASAAVAASPIPALVAQRLETLKSADLDAWKKAKEECEKSARELAIQGPKLRGEARDAYENARLNSDVAKEIQKQMVELDQKLDQTLRDLPEVKSKLEEVQRTEQAMLVELQVRTALGSWIAAREKEAAAAAPE